jgi:hypothetical protein
VSFESSAPSRATLVSADGKLVARGQVRFHVLDVLPAERSDALPAERSR